RPALFNGHPPSPITRAIALTERTHVTALVANHLDLDTTRVVPDLLEIDGRAAVRCPGPRTSALQARPQSLLALVDLHSDAAAAAGGLDDPVQRQVGLGWRRGADVDRLIRIAAVDGVAVRVGINGDGGDAQLPARSHDADCDLTSIGDQDLLEEPLHFFLFGA